MNQLKRLSATQTIDTSDTINTINHMAQWNLFDVVNSVILKFPADDL